MATERQIAANRRNASRSTGPKSVEGKVKSRANALKHGMAGASSLVEAGSSAAFDDRRARWAAEYRPVGEVADWALDRAVAASLRIEHCERAVEEVASVSQQRATLAWDQDRGVEAATVARRLAGDPVLASRQLQTSRAGAELLVEAWFGLLAKLETGEDWSESEKSRALDLLGVASDLRSGRTMIDADSEADSLGFHRSLAFEEIDRLEALVEEALGPLDALERRVAMGGHSALLSKPAKLILRYERDAWRRYRESIREVTEFASLAVVVDSPSPVINKPAEVRERAVVEVSASTEEECRAMPDSLEPAELLGEFAWFDDLERRVEEAGLDGLGDLVNIAEGGEDFGVASEPRPNRLVATERTRLVRS